MISVWLANLLRGLSISLTGATFKCVQVLMTSYIIDFFVREIIFLYLDLDMKMGPGWGNKTLQKKSDLSETFSNNSNKKKTRKIILGYHENELETYWNVSRIF